MAWRVLLATPTPPELGPAKRAGTFGLAELEAKLKPVMAGNNALPVEAQQCARALVLLWHDHLEVAHGIAQDIPSADGSFVHAIMHRREPDAWNSKYWWRRVGQHPCFAELTRRASGVCASAPDVGARLLAGGCWSPEAFVDLCSGALAKREAAPRVLLLRELQRVETETLLDSLCQGV
jgi:hypothetical protein